MTPRWNQHRMQHSMMGPVSGLQIDDLLEIVLLGHPYEVVLHPVAHHQTPCELFLRPRVSTVT
jgi:hypothetical protein